jgi:hypothetical protein
MGHLKLALFRIAGLVAAYALLTALFALFVDGAWHDFGKFQAQWKDSAAGLPLVVLAVLAFIGVLTAFGPSTEVPDEPGPADMGRGPEIGVNGMPLLHGLDPNGHANGINPGPDNT